MSSHINLDDDLERPPPSAQPQPPSRPEAAEIRSFRTAGPRPIASQRDARLSRACEARGSSHATATSPAADHSSSRPQNNHNPASSSSAKPNSTSQPPLASSSVAPATRTFDPWNSSSTGHQRAENRLSGSTSWRDSRNLKLRQQFRGGLNGGKRVADTVGARSADFGKDGRKSNGWEGGAKGLRTSGQRSLTEVWGTTKASSTAKSSQEELDGKCDEPRHDEQYTARDENAALEAEEENTAPDPNPESFSKPVEKQIFEGLCFYLNGTTAPLVSDHKLKHMLAAHGAKHSIALGRRNVTHVVLGTTCGGGLAASKIQKEIARTGGKSVKFVTAEWVLESIKANRRLPQPRFSPLKLAPKNQNTFFGTTRTQLSTKPSG